MSRQSRNIHAAHDVPMTYLQLGLNDADAFGDDESADKVVEFYKHHDDGVMELMEYDIFSDLDFEFQEDTRFSANAWY